VKVTKQWKVYLGQLSDCRPLKKDSDPETNSFKIIIRTGGHALITVRK
jgi:hypothetical protein